ncbi:uncharacterized protein LOC104903466 [Beta vulgaris subsp. vulgaris]|uniref:uncharacterized protein LOC104903466 n=1 Tax=Beta vulgaris subsp. vulgaris TaxID=3555 RepID=UPI00053F4DBE|nr:uncharacterized protein LOC104903466 [Beta vulgaris subsp. vulgaris]
MGLKFIAPELIDGKPIAKLDKNDVSKLSEVWINSIIVYVVGQNPTFIALMSYVKAHWNLASEPKIFEHEEGYFVVKLTNEEYKERILFSGPHMFYGKPIIVKPWSPSFNFHSEILKVIPIWVKFPNLPLHYWSGDSLSRIGSLLGIPIYADECTFKALRVSFVRVLIEMDITKEIPKEIHIVEPSGMSFSQKVTYDWRPAFCTKCSTIGHNCENLRSNPKPQTKVIPKWVPKGLLTTARTEQASVAVVTGKPPTGDPVVLVDVGLTGDPSTIVDLSMVVTPVNTPNVSALKEDQNECDDQGAWKLIIRKFKDKNKQIAYQSAKLGIVRRNNVVKARKKLGSEWSWEDNNDYSPKGRIWIGRKPGSLQVQVVSKSEQVIVVDVENYNCRYSDLCGCCVWQELLQISEECVKPLILIGDFNAISQAADRLNGAPVTEAETQDLSNFIMESQLMEAPSTGLFYSWSNKSLGDERVNSRIDRAYVNEAWNVRFPDVSV